MNNTVELIESVCETYLTEIELLVRVPYEGELTDCYALGIYDENGLRSIRVVTYEDYHTIYDSGSTGTLTQKIENIHAIQIEDLLNNEL